MGVGVLFICLGNICRSPMAEAVMRTRAERAGLNGQIVVDSAGTGDWHIGDPPHFGTRQILQQYDIDSTGMTARQLRAGDLQRFDYLIVMDTDNFRAVERLIERNGYDGEMGYLLDYADSDLTQGTRDVPDPYFDDRFDWVYRLIDSGCQGLLAHIVEEHGLTTTAA